MSAKAPLTLLFSNSFSSVNCLTCSSQGTASDMNCDSCSSDKIIYEDQCYEIIDSSIKRFINPEEPTEITSCHERHSAYIKEDSNLSASKEKDSNVNEKDSNVIAKNSKLPPLEIQSTKEDYEITISKAMFTTIIDSLLKKDKKIEELELENQLLKKQLKSRKT